MDTSLLKSYDILLCKGTGFTSKLIQVGTGSIYNHVAVVVDPKIFLGIESNTGHQDGVRAVDLRKLSESAVDTFRIKPEFTFNGDKVLSFLVDGLGARYDWGGVISLGLLKAASLLTFGKWKYFHTFQKEKDYFCSEFLYAAFFSGGLDIVPQIGQAEITSPGDIARSERLVKV